MSGARRAALTALEKCRRSGAWSDAVLGSVMDAEGLNTRDRALATALCYGVLQNRSMLEHVLQTASSRPLRKIEPKVLDILRLSAYQLLYLDKIPPSAAVNEGVSLCRSLGFSRAAGFVNALLRHIAAMPSLPAVSGSPAERLSIQYSHPRWLVDSLINLLGENETEAFLRCDNAPAPVVMQVNTLRADIAEVQSLLALDRITAERHPFLPDCLTADVTGDLRQTSAFQKGLFFVQDAAANMAIRAAQPETMQRILDVCAAPGGKSFAAAILSGNRAEITACDLHEKKLARIAAGAERLGLLIQTRAEDASVYRSEKAGKYDLVIADVPCSGFGVIRKKPDIRYKDPSAFSGLPEIQYRILSNVSEYVRPDGVLLYSTCTVRPEENQEIVMRFLAENPSFLPEDFTAENGCKSEEGMLQFWPQRHDTDGFFAAKLRKNR